jgi:hypothetical protein
MDGKKRRELARPKWNGKSHLPINIGVQKYGITLIQK